MEVDIENAVPQDRIDEQIIPKGEERMGSFDTTHLFDLESGASNSAVVLGSLPLLEGQTSPPPSSALPLPPTTPSPEPFTIDSPGQTPRKRDKGTVKAVDTDLVSSWSNDGWGT